MSRTAHQNRVFEFMQGARQATPAMPIIPNAEVRLLRARLILEEALETVHALGVSVCVTPSRDGALQGSPPVEILKDSDLSFTADKTPDLIEIADGCADLSVVTTGTLIACGIRDNAILEAVDQNNLDKLKPGHSFREDGKLVKPKDHPKVDLAPIIAEQQSWAKKS